jgi:hypothetical protein
MLFGLRLPKKVESPTPDEMIDSLRSLVQWSDEANVYRRGCLYLRGFTVQRPTEPHSAGIDELSAWLNVWKLPATQSVEGVIRFHDRPESSSLQPLRLDTVEERSGPKPEPVGADPDRVGPPVR